MQILTNQKVFRFFTLKLLRLSRSKVGEEEEEEEEEDINGPKKENGYVWV